MEQRWERMKGVRPRTAPTTPEKQSEGNKIHIKEEKKNTKKKKTWKITGKIQQVEQRGWKRNPASTPSSPPSLPTPPNRQRPPPSHGPPPPPPGESPLWSDCRHLLITLPEACHYRRITCLVIALVMDGDVEMVFPTSKGGCGGGRLGLTPILCYLYIKKK